MTKQQISPAKWVITILCIAVAVLGICVTVLLLRPVVIVSTFEQCKNAGGALLETYPEQCMINGTAFTNTVQPTTNTDHFIGMTEGDALARAKQSNIPARVVERDGTALPVTMDFTFGRHNFYVKEGKVYKVEIEGQAVDN